jgi:hypothetical protein
METVLEAEPDLAAPEADPGERVTTLAFPESQPTGLRFRRIGHVRLGGPLHQVQLAVYWIVGYAGGLFVPFRDATAGRESYGAGRYLLDTVKGADLGGDPTRGALLLDFNMAYSPSCAYDPRWACPLAPPDSFLTERIPAGERLYLAAGSLPS